MELSESATVKYENAVAHLNNLNKILANYYMSDPIIYSLEQHLPDIAKDNYHIIVDHIKPLPNEVHDRIGDVLNNLRSTLDHIIWSLVKNSGNVTVKDQDIYFPICDRRPSKPFTIQPALSANDLSFIDSVQPYTFTLLEDSPLFTLKELVNTDKHRYIPLKNISYTSTTFAANGNEIIRIKSETPIVINKGSIVQTGNAPSMAFYKRLQSSFNLELVFALSEKNVVNKPVLKILNELISVVKSILDHFYIIKPILLA